MSKMESEKAVSIQAHASTSQSSYGYHAGMRALVVTMQV